MSVLRWDILSRPPSRLPYHLRSVSFLHLSQSHIVSLLASVHYLTLHTLLNIVKNLVTAEQEPCGSNRILRILEQSAKLVVAKVVLLKNQGSDIVHIIILKTHIQATYLVEILNGIKDAILVDLILVSLLLLMLLLLCESILLPLREEVIPDRVDLILEDLRHALSGCQSLLKRDIVNVWHLRQQVNLKHIVIGIAVEVKIVSGHRCPLVFLSYRSILILLYKLLRSNALGSNLVDQEGLLIVKLHLRGLSSDLVKHVELLYRIKLIPVPLNDYAVALLELNA